jgi:hypothetical protein
MNAVEALAAERLRLRSDLLAGKKPKRVFMLPWFTLEAACIFAGINPFEANYRLELVEQAYTKICDTFPSDGLPVINVRFPHIYQMLGARNWILGSSGTLQHPEIETMREDEYDEFIAAPYKTIIEKFLPRVCTALDTEPLSRGLKLAAAYGAFQNANTAHSGLCDRLIRKYGYAPGFITNQMIEAPFDFLADQLRGFRAIHLDVRRCPDKIKAAVEAITPLMIKMAVPPAATAGLVSFIPLHLAPFLGQRAFEELYWPSFEKTIVELDKKGIACCLFVEQDWTRYCGYLERLPSSAIMFMEGGDPKRFTETVGREHVFGGFFDPTITLGRSKQECIDAAKKLLDTCMKSGHFYFCFDRSVLDMRSVDVPKLQAVLEWIYENGKYQENVE